MMNLIKHAEAQRERVIEAYGNVVRYGDLAVSLIRFHVSVPLSL